MNDTLKTLSELRADLAALMAERYHKQVRLARLQAHRPRPGCEHIANRARRRYMDEINDIDRQITMIEANMEGLST